MRNPYTIQSMLSVQHAIGRTMSAEVSYIRTDGRDFPLQRQFPQAFDRQTARAKPVARRARRLLRGQQPDDGLQRPATTVQAVQGQLLLGMRAAGRGRGDAGGRPVPRPCVEQRRQLPEINQDFSMRSDQEPATTAAAPPSSERLVRHWFPGNPWRTPPASTPSSAVGR